MKSRYTIGIDIGGTRTHAVLCDGDKILNSVNKTHLDNIKHGIVETIQLLLSEANTIMAVNPIEIHTVMVGTTQFVNQILQKKGLSPVFTIRLGAPATTAIKPAADWPFELKSLIGNQYAIVEGGYEFNGEEISPLDITMVESLGNQIIAEGIHCIAVSCVFSHVNPKQELMVYNILKKINPDFRIYLSHQMGDLGLLARENATILNAAISDAFDSYLQHLQGALDEANLGHAGLLLSSNNGTIERAGVIFPIQTYGSGPSNSIRGATRLLETRTKYSIVADIGGTSTDVGINVNGFPLPAGSEIKIGDEKDGFSCNFPSPLTVSCALGGGSIVLVDQDNNVTVGPVSVGSDLQIRSQCFGGNDFTVTDIAVVKNRLEIGNKTLLKGVSVSMIDQADEMIHQKLADMINTAILYTDSTEQLQLILVGGGASLFDLKKLRELLNPSICDIVIPNHAASANAIGAAIAMIHGQYSKVYQYEDTPTAKGMIRENVIADARANAIKNAIDKGADSETIKEIGITEIPLTYLPGALHNVKVEVIGMFDPENDVHLSFRVAPSKKSTYSAKTHSIVSFPTISSNIDPQKKQFVEDLALGAGVLGSGGGGDTSLASVMMSQLLNEPQWMKLNELDDHDLVVAVAAMGTPTVGIEKIFSENEFELAINQYEEKLARKITAIIPLEGAGFNALLPAVVAEVCGKKLVDGDCMGRAFPELQMNMVYIYGKNKIPYNAVVSNCKNATYVNVNDVKTLEDIARGITIEKGGTVFIACMPMTGKQAKLWCIPDTLSFCREMGTLIRTTRIDDRVAALRKLCQRTAYGPINSLGSGRIIELHRSIDGGFNLGWMVLLTKNRDRIKIEFQNENLRVINCTTNCVLAIVPDIITLLDVKGKAISSEMLKVGLEISSILTIGAPALLKTKEALAVVGPDKFHLYKS